MLNPKKIQNRLKATVRCIIVAFIYSLLILSVTYFLFSKPIQNIFTMIDLISTKTNEKMLEDVKLDLTTKNLQVYPEYGSKYADLSIPTLNIEQPIYYGDSLDILKYGVGQYIASYFPGEGGSILYMGHNTSNMLRKLPEIQIGDKITVTTTYGTYTYSVTETKIIQDTDLDQVPIQREKEILMIYTCYPVTTVVYTPYRFVVYADLVQS